MQVIKRNDQQIYLNEFENILNNVPVVSYNDDMIEIPGVVIFTVKQNWISRLLNPGIEIISVEENDFESMINSIKLVENEDLRIKVKSRTKPYKTNIFNLKVLKDQFIFARTESTTLMINDLVFTNSDSEFHGSGLFTNRKAYYMDFESIAKIKEYVLGKDTQDETTDAS